MLRMGLQRGRTRMSAEHTSQLWPSGSSVHTSTGPQCRKCGRLKNTFHGMKRKREYLNYYLTFAIHNGIIQLVKDVQTFTEAERTWICLTQNPYASLSLHEMDDEEAMIARPNLSIALLGNCPELSPCLPLPSTAAAQFPSLTT
jgi:hypothetical protein